MTTIHVDDIKDLMKLLSICMLFYLFGFYVTRKINFYFQRKRLENDFRNIFTDKFLAKLKREVTISKFKMNSKKYAIQNYVPINPNKITKNRTFNDLDLTLKQMTFNEIVNDPDYHFENSYISNFDLIHHGCRGDELSYSKKHYETISNKKIKEEIVSEDVRNHFVSSAIKSERKDVIIEKQIFKEHFNRELVEENLQKKGCFFIIYEES